MPLTEGCSQKAVEENIAQLIEEGKPQEQAVAIAFDVAWQNRKKCGAKRQKKLRQSRKRAGLEG